MPYPKILTTAAIVFILDRLTKFWVVEWLSLDERYAIDVFPPYLNLRMAWNDGINFGLFGSGGENTRWILISIAIGISLVVLYWARHAKGWKAPISAGLVVGGAMGNVYDRVTYGAVADFLNVSCCGFRNPFAFNIADATIFLGLFGLVFFLEDKKKS